MRSCGVCTDAAGPFPIALALAALCLTAPGAGAAAPDAMGDWTFDEGAGQSVLDAGPHALHGVLGESDAIADDDPARIAGPVRRRAALQRHLGGAAAGYG